MVYDRICLMLPTFKRPDKLKTFLDSAIGCASDTKNLCAIFCVNENDEESFNCIRQYNPPFDHHIVRENTIQPNLALYYNTMYEYNYGENVVVSMVGDDMEFKTHGYDTAILNAINEKQGKAIVYCDDDFIAHEKLCVQVFTTRLMVSATGKPFMCPQYHADMIDVVWTNVGLLTGTLVYLRDVVIKHNHESHKKKADEFDETCKRMMPLRALANQAENRAYGWRYAHICAANMIDNGIGKWSVL